MICTRENESCKCAHRREHHLFSLAERTLLYYSRVTPRDVQYLFTSPRKKGNIRKDI